MHIDYTHSVLGVEYALANSNIHAAIIDDEWSGDEGEQIIQRATAIQKQISIIVLSFISTPERIVRYMKLGINDYLIKPLSTAVIQRALIDSTAELISKTDLNDVHSNGIRSNIPIYGKSQAIQQLIVFIQKSARTSAPVLLFGETGTGKDLVAQFIHQLSKKNNHRFVPINCSAIPETLFESEMFGSEAGAFTDAIKREGIFGRAHKGTLFLDEIGDLSLLSQTKILRAIESKTYIPLGSTKERHTDIRIIAATNRDLQSLIKKEKFREDLYYRLAVLMHTITPLRERTEDIPPIAWEMLKKISHNNKYFTTSAIDKLIAYRWPGNVRELRNCIERVVAMSDNTKISNHEINFLS